MLGPGRVRHASPAPERPSDAVQIQYRSSPEDLPLYGLIEGPTHFQRNIAIRLGPGIPLILAEALYKGTRARGHESYSFIRLGAGLLGQTIDSGSASIGFLVPQVLCYNSRKRSSDQH